MSVIFHKVFKHFKNGSVVIYLFYKIENKIYMLYTSLHKADYMRFTPVNAGSYSKDVYNITNMFIDSQDGIVYKIVDNNNPHIDTNISSSQPQFVQSVKIDIKNLIYSILNEKFDITFHLLRHLHSYIRIFGYINEYHHDLNKIFFVGIRNNNTVTAKFSLFNIPNTIPSYIKLYKELLNCELPTTKVVGFPLFNGNLI